MPAVFFIGENGRRLSIHMVRYTFARVRRNIIFREPQAGRGCGPRCHDLRHIMASMTILCKILRHLTVIPTHLTAIPA